jgi:hypothetical protein
LHASVDRNASADQRASADRRAPVDSRAMKNASTKNDSTNEDARENAAIGGGSPSEARSLDALENWFQAEIVRPHEAKALGNASRAKIASDAPALAKDWILPSRHLRPKERVAVYTRMYFSRLLECMQADYPSVAQLAGEHGFEKLVRAYLLKYPSRHYSLNLLGARLPEFLGGSVRVPRRPLLHDVAELELLMTEVFDAAESRVLASSDLAAIAPETWANARPRLIDALRLGAFDHRANAIVSATRQGETLPELSRKKTWVVVYRKAYVVWRMDLTQPMHAVLTALAARKTLCEAIEAGATVFRGSAEELQAQIFQWFAEWVAEGFFTAIE